jgi:hypothetical protein
LRTRFRLPPRRKRNSRPVRNARRRSGAESMIRVYGFLKSLKLALALILPVTIGSVGAIVIGEWIAPGTPIEALAAGGALSR